MDTTQRRKRFPTEESLHAIRREYIERARGLGIAVIFNTSVHGGNLDEIPGLVRFFLDHSDVVGMASFQVQAATGRGEWRARAPEVTMAAIRERITAGVGEGGSRGTRRSSATPTATRPRCSRRSAAAPSTSSRTRPSTRRFLEEMKHVPFDRRDVTGTARRVLLALARRPWWLLRGGAFVLSRLWRVRRELLARRKTGKITFFIQNFMDADALDEERIANCSFMVMTDDGPVSMCAHNARRDDYILKPLALPAAAGGRGLGPEDGRARASGPSRGAGLVSARGAPRSGSSSPPWRRRRRGSRRSRAPSPGRPSLPRRGRRFAPLHDDRGVAVGVARLPGGAVVLRARASLDAFPDRVLATLEEVARWPSWIRRLRSFELLPGEPPAFAAVFAAPWPLRDRAYALAPATTRGPRHARRLLGGRVRAARPPASGRVRVAPVRGCFAVAPGPAEAPRLSRTRSSIPSGRACPRGCAAPAARRAPFASSTACARGCRRIDPCAPRSCSSRWPRPPSRPRRAAPGSSRPRSSRPRSTGPPRPSSSTRGERRAFEAGRVPGSRNVDWRDFSAVRPGGLAFVFRGSARWGLLADGARLVPKLRALGVSASRPVVVVGSPEGWGEEARIGWMLLALGAADVALLDGGFPSWQKREGARVERGPAAGPASPPGDFEPAPTSGRRIGADALRDLLAVGTPVLLDARTEEEFAGKKLTGQARGGRLPGARLVPLAALRAPDGRYASAEALARAAGPLAADRTVVTYCTGGVRSALLAFLLEARLGIVAANYDGSLWEWSSREDLPMETGPSP